MENNVMEVMYAKYCSKCKHKDVPENEEPCEECLTAFYREDGSEKPTKYVAQNPAAIMKS